MQVNLLLTGRPISFLGRAFPKSTWVWVGREREPAKVNRGREIALPAPSPHSKPNLERTPSIKLVWVSDASNRPADAQFQTGFGRASAQILQYLHSKGHELHEIGVGYMGQHTRRPPWEIYSPTAYGRPEGQDGAPIIAMAVNADALVAFMDVPDLAYLGSPLNYRDRREGRPLKPEIINAIEGRPWKALALTVIDGCLPNERLPKDWEGAFKGIDGAAVASRWARRLVKENFGVDVAYHPHGVDLDFFRQCPKDEARKQFKLPQHAFVVGFVGVNRSRKMIPAAFETVAKFAEMSGRDDIVFWIHSGPPPVGLGHDLQSLSDAYELEKKGVLCIHTRHVPENAMPWLYSSLDILLHTSGGEGFGCVVLEAQACRTPVLVTDYTSQADLVPTDFQKIPVKSLIPFPANNISWAWPDTDIAAERLMQIASDKGLRTMLKRQGWEYATQYAWPRVLPPFEAWLEAMIEKPSEKPVELVAV